MLLRLQRQYFAGAFHRCTLPPTSTKARHPSSRTEKMCLETELESYKALLVVVLSFELIYVSV
eukprot:scaffold16645_cov86-Skeletonema_dohrnii-CCMP3373.AAC.4